MKGVTFFHSLIHLQISPLSYLQSTLLTAAAATAKLLQSCLTLCDPLDGSPPGSPIPGILQARTLEWVAISGQWLLNACGDYSGS